MHLKESDMPEESEWKKYFPHPRDTLQALGLRRGMIFADLGCGYGTFTIPAAEIVGKKGTVYAVDLDPLMIDRVLAKLRSKKLKNVRAIVGDMTSLASIVSLPRHRADFVLLSNVIHGTKNKVSLLKSVSTAILSKKGKIVVLIWNVAKTPRGPPMKMRSTPERIVSYLKRAGYDSPRVVKVLPFHYAVAAGD